jgi:hypothetical protein
LFFLSWHLFLSFQSSQLLSFLHAHNLKFLINLIETRWNLVGCVQGMRCTKEIYRVRYGIRRCTGLSMWKSRYQIHDEASKKR